MKSKQTVFHKDFKKLPNFFPVYLLSVLMLSHKVFEWHTQVFGGREYDEPQAVTTGIKVNSQMIANKVKHYISGTFRSAVLKKVDFGDISRLRAKPWIFYRNKERQDQIVGVMDSAIKKVLLTRHYVWYFYHICSWSAIFAKFQLGKVHWREVVRLKAKKSSCRDWRLLSYNIILNNGHVCNGKQHERLVF